MFTLHKHRFLRTFIHVSSLITVSNQILVRALWVLLSLLYLLMRELHEEPLNET
jgi:hypothetical protein